MSEEPTETIQSAPKPAVKRPARKKPVTKKVETSTPEPKTAKAEKELPINEGDPTELTRKALTHDKKVTVRINSTELDKEDVFVAVNGLSYTIQRDKDVEIPFSLYQTLLDAKSSVYRQVKREDGEGMQLIETEIQRFSMSARF